MQRRSGDAALQPLQRIDAVAKAWNAAHPKGPPMLPYPPYIDATPGRGERLALLSGRVNVLGKLIPNVRTQGDAYVDSNLLSAFLAPITALHYALLRDPPRGYTDDPGLVEELYGDVTVLPPGGLIIPVAIYK